MNNALIFLHNDPIKTAGAVSGCMIVSFCRIQHLRISGLTLLNDCFECKEIVKADHTVAAEVGRIDLRI